MDSVYILSNSELDRIVGVVATKEEADAILAASNEPSLSYEEFDVCKWDPTKQIHHYVFKRDGNLAAESHEPYLKQRLDTNLVRFHSEDLNDNSDLPGSFDYIFTISFHSGTKAETRSKAIASGQLLADSLPEAIKLVKATKVPTAFNSGIVMKLATILAGLEGLPTLTTANASAANYLEACQLNLLFSTRDQQPT